MITVPNVDPSQDQLTDTYMSVPFRGRGSDDHSHFPEEESLSAGVRVLLFLGCSPGWGDPMYILAVTPPTASQNHPAS